jgi:1-acyl-sn-glycerol-3-phosphate acyltransferase
MGGGEGVVTFFLALFSVGIGLGSMQCKRLSGNKIEPGLVPFGSLGLSIFSADLFFAAPALPLSSGGTLLSLGEFLSHGSAWRVAFDLFFLSFFGGLYIVPLMTMIQSRSEKKLLSRVIASNNILNAFAMVVASISLVALLGAGVSVPTIFLILSVLNLGVALYIYRLMPEFTLRFANWILAHSIYRIRHKGTENFPESGPFIIVCNHVSYVDWMILQSCCRRPIRFVMDHTFLRLPLVGFLFRDAKVIPIAQAKENPMLKEAAFVRVQEELARGQIVCIFPEGRLTRDGELGIFRGGIERVLAESKVPVIPVALGGLWNSVFSRNPKSSFLSIFTNWGKRIDLAVGDSVPPEMAKASLLEARVKALLDTFAR